MSDEQMRMHGQWLVKSAELEIEDRCPACWRQRDGRGADPSCACRVKVVTQSAYDKLAEELKAAQIEIAKLKADNFVREQFAQLEYEMLKGKIP